MVFWMILIPKHDGNSVELGESSGPNVYLSKNLLVVIKGNYSGLFVMSNKGKS